MPDADSPGLQVEGGSLPVGDVVRLLDQHLADVVELLGGDKCGDGRDVVHDDGRGRGVTLGKSKRRGRHAPVLPGSSHNRRPRRRGTSPRRTAPATRRRSGSARTRRPSSSARARRSPCRRARASCTSSPASQDLQAPLHRQGRGSLQDLQDGHRGRVAADRLLPVQRGRPRQVRHLVVDKSGPLPTKIRPGRGTNGLERSLVTPGKPVPIKGSNGTVTVSCNACRAARPGSVIRRCGSKRSGVADRADVELELDLVRDEHAAGLERGVPGEAPVLAVDGDVTLEADPDVAERVLSGAGLLEDDRDRLGGALDGQVAGDASSRRRRARRTSRRR